MILIFAVMQKIFIIVLILLAFSRCSNHDDQTRDTAGNKTLSPPFPPLTSQEGRCGLSLSPPFLPLTSQESGGVYLYLPPSPLLLRKRGGCGLSSQESGFQKKRSFKRKKINKQEIEIEKSVSDSVRREKIEWLLKTRTEIDLNEPKSRNFLFNGINDLADRPFTIVSREKFLKINFDNDILDNTDHFYTNGIRLELVSPALKNLPFRYLMLPYFGYGINYYGIALTQNMYTPSTTKVGGILEGDRPYAAYLCFSFYKVSNDPAKMMRQTSEFSFGVIGPLSGGDFVQTTFHNSVPTNHEPLGWNYQVKNDLALNYRLTFEKGLVSYPTFDLNINGSGELGTLNTNLSGGFSLRAGMVNPYFKRLWITPKQVNEATGMRNMQVYFFMKVNGAVVGYDATLQGGMFNRSSVYTISSSNISRILFHGSSGVTISLGGVRLDIEQFVISPEFRNGWWHKWVHLGLTCVL